MTRSVWRDVRAVLLVLTLLPSVADANAIDFPNEGHGSALAVAGVRFDRQIVARSAGGLTSGATDGDAQEPVTVKVSEPSTLLLMGVAFLLFARRASRDRHRT